MLRSLALVLMYLAILWPKYAHALEVVQSVSKSSSAIQEDEKAVDMKMAPGDMYLHLTKVPYSPMREAGSFGLVIERKRTVSEMQDGLLWFCDSGKHKLNETYFELRDIEKDLMPRLKEFYGSEDKWTCSSCGDVLPKAPRLVEDYGATSFLPFEFE